MLNWMNGRRQGYIKTVKCLFLRKKKKGEEEGFKMIVVTLPSASEQSQCYKLNPALRALVSGTIYCSLVRHFQESVHNMLLTNCGSSTQSRETRLTTATIPSPKTHITSERQGSGHLWTTWKRWIRRKEGRRSLTSKQNQARSEVCIRVRHYLIL